MILGSLLFLFALLVVGSLMCLVRWALFKPGPETPRPRNAAAEAAELAAREAADRRYWHIKAHGRPPRA